MSTASCIYSWLNNARKFRKKEQNEDGEFESLAEEYDNLEDESTETTPNEKGQSDVQDEEALDKRINYFMEQAKALNERNSSSDRKTRFENDFERIEYYANKVYKIEFDGRINRKANSNEEVDDEYVQMVLDIFNEMLAKTSASKWERLFYETVKLTLKKYCFNTTKYVFSAMYVICINNEWDFAKMCYSLFSENEKYFDNFISFNSFGLVLQTVKKYELDTNFAQEVLDKVWNQNFEFFFESVTSEDLKYLSEVDQNWNLTNWTDKILEFMKDHAYDVKYCLFNTNLDFLVKDLLCYFPQITSEVLKWDLFYYLHSFQYELFDMNCYQERDINAKVLEILSLMEDYSIYQSVNCSFTKKEQLDIFVNVMERCDGTVLTELYRVFHKLYRFTMEEYFCVVDAVVMLLMYNNGLDGEQEVLLESYFFEPGSSKLRVEKLADLLSNPVVYNAVKERNYDFIRSFNC